MSNSRDQGRAYFADPDDMDIVGRRRRGITVGRVVLNIVVLAAFGVAVFTLYTLVQNSGILAESTEEVVTGSMFVDIPDTHPHGEDLEQAAILGLVEISTPTRFGVREAVTRGDLAGVVVRTLGLRVPRDGVQPFADVEGDPEALDQADYVAIVAEQGLMDGKGGDPPLFDPDTTASLGEVLVAFARAGGDALPEANPTETSDSDTTTDSTTVDSEVTPEGPSEAQTAHARLTAAGILDGVDIDSTEEALKVGADRDQVALIALNLRRFRDSL